MTRITIGHLAPKFELPDVNGRPVSLAKALDHGPVVAAFFKITCPVCQFTFPFLERLHKAYGGAGATFLGISQDDKKDTKEFFAEYRIAFAAVPDDDGYPVSNAYGLTNVPTVLLIDRSGKVLVSSVGFVKADLEAIAERLSELLGRPPVPVFQADEAIPEYKPG